MKTLKEFLEKNNACEDGFDFAKDLTLEQFLSTCQRGDWILWLFARTNPDSLRELNLAKGHCANTVRELMKDELDSAASAMLLMLLLLLLQKLKTKKKQPIFVENIYRLKFGIRTFNN